MFSGSHAHALVFHSQNSYESAFIASMSKRHLPSLSANLPMAQGLPGLFLSLPVSGALF